MSKNPKGEMPETKLDDGSSAAEGESAGTAADPLARLAELEAELEAARAEAAENRDRWLRAAAEFENFRRRAARELDESAGRGRAEVLLEVVAVLDDVDRALGAMGVDPEGRAPGRPPVSEIAAAAAQSEPGMALLPDDDPVVAGVRLIRARLAEILRRFGVVEMEAEGRIFDPHVHDAVLQVPALEVPEGCVAQVLQRGYWFGERVLRPAKVAVARGR